MSVPYLGVSQRETITGEEWCPEQQPELPWPPAGQDSQGAVSVLNPLGSSGTSWAASGSSTDIILTRLALWDDLGCGLACPLPA